MSPAHELQRAQAWHAPDRRAFERLKLESVQSRLVELSMMCGFGAEFAGHLVFILVRSLGDVRELAEPYSISNSH